MFLAVLRLRLLALLPRGGRQTGTVRALVRLLVLVWLSGPAVRTAEAAFSSLYVFGDGVCSTTGNLSGGWPLYHDHTYSNGDIWIEVLAQRQGLPYSDSRNWSDMWHDSVWLLGQLNGFNPGDAPTSLFVVWVSDADFVNYMQYGPYPSLDTTAWNNAISASLTRHAQAIATLYAKGARTFIMPNAVDVTKIPAYNGLYPYEKSFIAGRVSYFNSGFAAVVNQAKAAHPDLKICIPNFFALLENMVAQPGAYGFINTTSDALSDGYTMADAPGANYLWWDTWDPTAKAHSIMADTVKPLVQLLTSPPSISRITWLGSSNRLEVTNLPVGLPGFVDGRTSLVAGAWTNVINFNSTSVAQAILVPASGPRQFYRLRFPYW